MRTAIATILAAILPAATVVAFVPTYRNEPVAIIHATKTPDTIDIKHARYCADHFGECSLEEMEDIRNALHQERVSHAFTNADGINNPGGLKEDIEHKLLESDLAMQIGLLRDKLATERMQEDSTIVTHNGGKKAGMILDAGLDEESSEALMICLAIAGLALLPRFLNN